MTISNRGGKGSLGLGFHGTVHRRGLSVKPGADADAVEEDAYWLAPHGLLILLLSGPYAHPHTDQQPEYSITTVGWARPHQSLILKMPYRSA